MDKKFWENSLELLENLLKKKIEEREKQDRDIEEIEYSIKSYKEKIKSFPSLLEKVKSKLIRPLKGKNI